MLRYVVNQSFIGNAHQRSIDYVREDDVHVLTQWRDLWRDLVYCYVAAYYIAQARNYCPGCSYAKLVSMDR